MALRRATFRLYPTKKINDLLHYHRKLHKELYNAAIYNRVTSYKRFGKSVSYLEQQNCLPQFKETWTEYKQINSQALQSTLKRVDFAFERFFNGLSGYPKYKSIRRYSGWSYPAHSGWKCHSTGDNGYLELTKIGNIQMRGKARLWGNPKSLDIVYRNGKWYASVVLDIDDNLLRNSRKTDSAVIAIDLGCNDAVAWDNGDENGLIPAPKFFRKAEKKIKHLSSCKRRKRPPNYKKKQKASRRWKKVQQQISKVHRKVANQRQNWVHQITTRIVSGHSTVVTEKLEVKNMSAKAKKGKRKKQKTGLNKSILDVGMGMIQQSLKAKLDDVCGVFVEAPTKKIKPSQTCPKCGHQEKKSLDQRVHICGNPSCKYTQQRDIASCEVLLLWHSGRLPGFGTSLADAEPLIPTSRTRKTAGSMKQMGAKKHQKSCSTGEDVETSPSKRQRSVG